MCELVKSRSNALDPTLSLMRYLNHLKFLEYLLGVIHEGDRNADGRRSMFDVILSMKINV